MLICSGHLPLRIHPPNSTEEVFIVDVATKITVLVVFSALMQFCSLIVVGLMAENVSALLKAFMIVHYEKIAKWKYGENTAPESTATPMRPVAVQSLR
jgi:hypothetical protein